MRKVVASTRSPERSRRSAARWWTGWQKALKDPDPRVRRGAALALGQIRPVAAGISAKVDGRPR